jgi:hypothetical protein
LSVPFLYAAKAKKQKAYESLDPTNALMRFAGNIHQFNNIFPQEKVYLEFDNTAYFQGETIWFKAFVTHATTFKNAPSKVLYVDLIAPNGEVLRKQKHKIVGGQCDGAFKLLDVGTSQSREKRGMTIYPSGFYEIRAYTQNMLDFSKEAIFSRVIPVYTKPELEGEYDEACVILKEDKIFEIEDRDDAADDEKLRRVNVSFYPEGGDLVQGLPSRVAFKATGPDAFGIDGYIVTGGRDTARTLHDGMGSFMITPDGRETVQFIDSRGKSYSFSLPKSVKSGYTMIASSPADSVMNVNIHRTADRVGEHTALAVTCRGDLVYFEETGTRDSVELTLDSSLWPVGVCRMTLYNQDGKILSSRSLFHNNPEFQSPTVTLSLDSLSRQPFSMEVLNFKITDRNGNPLHDRFCLSVRDHTDYGTGHTDNLMTNLLLSSDLRGYIHEPAWYLESNDQEHRQALDLLTLVQGWERYEWKYMTGLTQFVERHRIEDSLTMNGWLLSYVKREPVKEVTVSASFRPDENKNRFESFKFQTDTNGYFGFDLSDFYGKGEMGIRLTRERSSGKIKHPTGIRIRFERADMPASRIFTKEEIDLNHNDRRNRLVQTQDQTVMYGGQPRVIKKDLGIVLDEVEIDEDRATVNYDEFVSYDVEEDTEMELDMGEYSTFLYDYLLSKGVPVDVDDKEQYTIRGHKIEYYIHNSSKYIPRKKPFDFPMLIDMIDVKSIIVYERPMRKVDLLKFMPIIELNRIDSLDRMYTEYEQVYLIDILVKEDHELLSYKSIRDLSQRKTKVIGYSEPVQFYAPQYPAGGIEGDIDARRTLYWNPNVITDNDGNARVEFYNNSYSKNFVISGAGLTAGGTPFVIDQDW